MAHVTRPSTELERVYAAGFFDGEGTVLIRHRKPTWQIGPRRKNGERRHGRWAAEQYSPGISIGNSNRAVLDWFSSIWGGGVSPHKQLKPESYCPMFYWQQTGVEGARHFLIEILPYLKIKTPMAMMLLEWLALAQADRPSTGAEFRLAIRRLNGSRFI